MGAPGQYNLGRESCQLEETLIEMNLNNKRCEACNEPLDPTMKILQCDGLYFHEECFVCSQCFQPFPEDGFYTYDDQRYCLRDYQVLYAPICKRCDDFIDGEVIKALNSNWCMDCFTCEECECSLYETQFVPFHYRGKTGTVMKVVCKPCFEEFRRAQSGKDICQYCWRSIENDEKHLKIRYKVNYLLNQVRSGQVIERMLRVIHIIVIILIVINAESN